MIRKLNGTDDEPKYIRANDEWYDVPIALAENETESVIQIRRPSIRRMRKQFTWAVTAFIVGSLLIIFQSPQRNNFLAPGRLSSSHAQLLNGMGAERCNACHDIANQSFLQWAMASLKPGRNIQVCQSELCMKCHQNTLDPGLATKPHHVAPELLASKSKLLSASPPGRKNPPVSVEDIECSTCHKEHHGERGLTLLTDQQCQTCHQQSFDSFEHGHPEFTNWPQNRRQSIAFDHVSHGYTHFPSSNTQFDCKMCHVDDSYSNVKTLASYEQSCAQCHDQDIQLRSQPGLQLVELPMLDLDAIQQHGYSIGTWPEDAAGDFDGRIPELMQMLLSCDKDFKEILGRRGGQFDFADLDPESPNDVKDAVEIAWSIKALIEELAAGGRTALSLKFAQALDVPNDDERIYLLTRGLDTDVFAHAASRWLPGLSKEIPTQDSLPPNSTAASESFGDLVSLVDSEFILPYMPSNLKQDEDTLIANPLLNLMKDRSHDKSSPRPSLPDAESGGAGHPSNNNRRNVEDDAGMQVGGVNRNPGQLAVDRPLVQQRSVADNELLVPNPLAGLNHSSRPSFEPKSEADQLKIAKEFSDEIERAKKTRTKVEDSKPSNSVAPFEVDDRGEVFVGSSHNSGWFRDDRLFRISYRPSGHADTFLTTMMDVVASQTDQTHSNGFFGKMVSDSSIGACNDCHTIDAQPDGMRMNWVAIYRDPALRSFTHFSHGPHLMQSELADCTACHQINPELTNAHTFEHFDSSTVVSNFEPIRKSNCVSCHHESGAGNSCTQCHDYHVGAKILMGN